MSTSSTPSNKTIAWLAGVRKSYPMGERNLEILKGINFSVSEGEYIALMGPSGAGKSTLLNLLGFLDSPTEGVYEFEGEDTARFSDRRLSSLRNRKIGFIFQSFNLFQRYTVQKNIEIPMIYAEYSRKERKQRAAELAEHVGLGHRLGHSPQQLSGGEMQRVAIARALSCRPSLILADEPTGNLDEHTSDEIMKLLSRLNSEGITIVMVTHNPELIPFVHRVIEVHDGCITEDRSV